jgi:hypothetical protein
MVGLSTSNATLLLVSGSPRRDSLVQQSEGGDVLGRSENLPRPLLSFRTNMKRNRACAVDAVRAKQSFRTTLDMRLSRSRLWPCRYKQAAPWKCPRAINDL